jgi:hypothetical protein
MPMKNVRRKLFPARLLTFTFIFTLTSVLLSRAQNVITMVDHFSVVQRHIH